MLVFSNYIKVLLLFLWPLLLLICNSSPRLGDSSALLPLLLKLLSQNFNCSSEVRLLLLLLFIAFIYFHHYLVALSFCCLFFLFLFLKTLLLLAFYGYLCCFRCCKFFHFLHLSFFFVILSFVSLFQLQYCSLGSLKYRQSALFISSV